MKLPATLLLTYQAEYETTPDLTIANICEKYNVETKQLKGYTKWTKRIKNLDIPEEPLDIIAIPESNQVIDPQVVEPKPIAEVLSDIKDFKELAVAHAIKFMRNDAEFAEVKEFKDMVAVVDSIEKSYKDTETGPTINVLIQSLHQQFKDTPDDC